MSLSAVDKIGLLKVMLASRLGDLREQSLIRQGKGLFHVSSMGHEAMAAIAGVLSPQDFLCPYYRDRALMLGRGVSTYELALDFYAKRNSSSGGRQMPGHFSNRRHNVWSLASPVPSNLLPACGIAWGMKLDGEPGVVLATCGDASTRQGDFYEAGSFAKERDLPMLFIVEDNGLGISSVTTETTPWGLGLLKKESWVEVDGSDVLAVHEAGIKALDFIRAGGGPVFMWMRTERISSHSSADDHRKYRPPQELEALVNRCPIDCFKKSLLTTGDITEVELQEIHTAIESAVRRDYQAAEQEADPSPADAISQIFGTDPSPPPLPLSLGKEGRLVDAVNGVFHEALRSEGDFLFFGQDIADPKGGVFSLTKGLSSTFPDRVFNSPLAESTILGVACGLASYGKRPVFEIQFVDFIWPGWCQLIANLSTLRWRSNGQWSCPCVIYAPCGAYLPGGSIWHSQTNEAAFAHFPGLRVIMPSTPEDAAGLIWSAMHGSDPTLVLIPKHRLWQTHQLPAVLEPIPLGQARQIRAGSDLTMVAWGNTVEIATEALEGWTRPLSVDFFDLRSLVPWDRQTIAESVRRTGRLIIVQEDGESCSIGQQIIAELSGDPTIFAAWRAQPVLVAKPNVNIGYNAALEFGVLPDKNRVWEAIRTVLEPRLPARMPELSPPAASPVRTAHSPASSTQVPTGAFMMAAFSESPSTSGMIRMQDLAAPPLGEGITHARVVGLLKKPGQTVEEDEAVCELETDKAVFPVESPWKGVLQKWLVEEGVTIAVGQTLAQIECPVESILQPVDRVEERLLQPAPAATAPTEGGLSPHIIGQLKNVVPTHMSILAGWDAIHKARSNAKKTPGTKAPSPTAMLAWCVTRAVEKHPIFACTINTRDTLTPLREFDLGVAVALNNDALDTAVIHKAPLLGWEDFVAAYHEAVQSVRNGKPSSKARAPLIITSLGGFAVRFALPVVVPPAIATLFIGEAYYDYRPDEKPCRQRVNLCLSFDHRWVNGVAGGAFLADVQAQMERFTIPPTNLWPTTPTVGNSV